jgi:glc operon protein GlcG
MITKYTLSATEVEAVLTAAKAEAVQNNWAVSIAVVDDGGFPQGLLRLDRASPSTALTAQAKARTAAISRRETKVFHEAINGGKPAMMTLPTLKGMLEGGVPLLHAGHVVCAVGVSGAKAEEDAQVARAGLAAITL